MTCEEWSMEPENRLKELIKAFVEERLDVDDVPEDLYNDVVMFLSRALRRRRDPDSRMLSMEWIPRSIASRSIVFGNRAAIDEICDRALTPRSLTILGALLERWLDFLIDQHPLFRWPRRKHLLLLRSRGRSGRRGSSSSFWTSICFRLPEPVFRDIITYL